MRLEEGRQALDVTVGGEQLVGVLRRRARGPSRSPRVPRRPTGRGRSRRPRSRSRAAGRRCAAGSRPRRRRGAPVSAAGSRRPLASVRPARGGAPVVMSSRSASQSRIPLSGASSPVKPASASCRSRSERPSSRGSGGGACSSCATNRHIVIHSPSRSCGPGGRRSLGGTARSVRSARKLPTATSRSSHCSGSSCRTAVPVITRATTGEGARCTSALLPAAIRTASSQATPCSRATACAAARALIRTRRPARRGHGCPCGCAPGRRRRGSPRARRRRGRRAGAAPVRRPATRSPRSATAT